MIVKIHTAGALSLMAGLVLSPLSWASGPGLAPPESEIRRGTVNPANRINDVYKSIALAQKRSRVALERFREVNIRSISRYHAAKEALAKCERKRPGACPMQEEELITIIADANEYIREAAARYRKTLLPLISLCHRDLAENVVSDPYIFQMLQRQSQLVGSDRLNDLVRTLDKLKQMVASADNIIRTKTNWEIERQEKVLNDLVRVQEELEKPLRPAVSTFQRKTGGTS